MNPTHDFTGHVALVTVPAPAWVGHCLRVRRERVDPGFRRRAREEAVITPKEEHLLKETWIGHYEVIPTPS